MTTILAFLPIFFVSLLYVLFLRFALKNTSYQNLFWIVSIITIFLLRSEDLYRLWSSCLDEEQWIICSQSLIDNPRKYFHEFYIYDFTRFFTILPLAIFGVLTNFEVGYGNARVLNIIFYIIIIYLNYKIISKKLGVNTSLIITCFAILFFGLSADRDFRSFNSEVVVIAELLSIMLLHLNSINLNNAKKQSFLLGLLVCLIPFTKEQGLFFTLFFFIYLSIYFIYNKQFVNLISYYAGGLLITVIMFIPLIIYNSVDDFIWVINNVTDYANNPVIESNKIINSINVFLLNKEYLLMNYVVIMFLLTLAFTRMNILKNIHIDFKQFDYLNLILLVLAIYTIILPGNYFMHYCFFLIPPLLWFFSRFITLVINFKNYYLLYFIFLLFFISKTFDSHRPYFYPIRQLGKSINYEVKDPFFTQIKSNSIEKEGLFVWGWHLSPFINCNLKRRTGFLYPQFALSAYKEKEKTIEKMLEEVKLNKPELILEILDDSRFFFTDKNHSMKVNAPEIYQYITDAYSIISKSNTHILYKIKS
jgi:hypothetical protein